MFGAMLRRTDPKPTPAETWTPPGPHTASVRAWVSNCREHSLAFEMRREGHLWRTQTVPKIADQTGRELGEAVAQAMGAENKGADWHRIDAIIGTALEAVGSGCFMDYLVATGEVDFKEGA